MTGTHPLTERGVVYWRSLLADPCPGCGYTGKEGDGHRSGTPQQTQDGVQYVLCVDCQRTAETLPDEDPRKMALGARIDAFTASHRKGV